MENPNIKDYCVACLKPIPISEERYQAYGNYCTTCSKRANDIVKVRGQISYLRNKIRIRKEARIFIDMKDLVKRKKEAEKELKKLISKCKFYVDIDFESALKAED